MAVMLEAKLADQGYRGGTESETLLMVDNRENNVKQGIG